MEWPLSPRRTLHRIRANISRIHESPAKWNRQYDAGAWDYMEELDQAPRYAVVVEYIARLTERARVLDVGCGTGILRRRLPGEAFSAYLGIDISDAAIAAATALEDERTRFRAVDLRDFDTAERFDAIVFNEVLYYLTEPETMLRRAAARWLAPGGIVVISMNATENRVFDWSALERGFRLLHATRTTSLNSGKAWVARVLRPGGA